MIKYFYCLLKIIALFFYFEVINKKNILFKRNKFNL
jgi:hypothetical protein